MAGLVCAGLTRRFGATDILSGLSLDVEDGSLCAILGASGSGKTTLLRIVMGFIRPDSGTVQVGERLLTDGRRRLVPPERRGIGYVAQEGALFPHLTVARNVAFGLPRRERSTSQRVSEVLELVGLGTEYAARQPHELSGGEQRRVALARVLSPRPALVLLDEPFSGLDAALRADTRAAVLAALREERTTAVLVTHDQAEAMSMGDQVGLLRAGRLVQTGSPQELYQRPADLEAARFLGSAIVVRGRAVAGGVECALGRLRVETGTAGDEVDIMLRPEQIELRPADAGGIAATVTAVEFLGPHSMVTVRLARDEEVAISATTASHAAPAVGDHLTLHISGPVVFYPAGDHGGGSVAVTDLDEAEASA